jgi:hypothetical protein
MITNPEKTERDEQEDTELVEAQEDAAEKREEEGGYQ